MKKKINIVIYGHKKNIELALRYIENDMGHFENMFNLKIEVRKSIIKRLAPINKGVRELAGK